MIMPNRADATPQDINMIGQIKRSASYGILNSLPGKKKGTKTGKKKPKVDYKHRDYRGPNGVLEDSQ